MASNYFGKVFRMTTFGESHGSHVGVVIDGCPSGIAISEKEINDELSLRAPGRSSYVSPRQEPDKAKIISGVFDHKTTGAPVTILIENNCVDSSPYLEMGDVLRPGHANYTYMKKYMNIDSRGGGRASARETAARVAASVLANKILSHFKIKIYAYIKQIGSISLESDCFDSKDAANLISHSEIFCPDREKEKEMKALLEEVNAAGDSVGGIVEFVIHHVPPGIGEPIYDKLNARLGYALLGIPAAKGFEVGAGMGVATMRGSQHNDEFVSQDAKIVTKTNHAGGVLGGLSNGMPIVGRVAFKPTSSIFIEQPSINIYGEKRTLSLPKNAKHDPCVAIRAVPVVKAMCSLVLVDLLLLNQLYHVVK